MCDETQIFGNSESLPRSYYVLKTSELEWQEQYYIL